MSTLLFELVSLFWVIAKIGLAVVAARIAYFLYGVHKGFIQFSE